MKRRTCIKCIFIISSLLSIVSCQSVGKDLRVERFDAGLVQDSIPQYLQTSLDEYRLKFGDRLSLVFMNDVKKDLTESYKLDIGDEVKVSIYDREDLSGTYMVVPDGWLHLPMIKPLKVNGLTVPEFGEVLAGAYMPLIGNVKVNVGLTRLNNRVSNFVNSVSQYNSQGAVYETTVEADGNAIFPQLGFIKLKGLNLREANQAITTAYKSILPTIDVTARLINTRGNVITVLGEVRRPGNFEISGSVSLIAALGLAEGWVPSAKIQTLIIVQQRKGELYVNKYDLETNLVGATQIQLAAGDMVFVPRTKIADVNVFVDQYIRRNIPINVGVGIPVSFN